MGQTPWTRDTMRTNIKRYEDVMDVMCTFNIRPVSRGEKSLIWDKVFKSGPSKVCGRQPFKNLKGIWSTWILCLIWNSLSREVFHMVSMDYCKHTFYFCWHELPNKTKYFRSKTQKCLKWDKVFQNEPSKIWARDENPLS